MTKLTYAQRLCLELLMAAGAQGINSSYLRLMHHIDGRTTTPLWHRDLIFTHRTANDDVLIITDTGREALGAAESAS